MFFLFFLLLEFCLFFFLFSDSEIFCIPDKYKADLFFLLFCFFFCICLLLACYTYLNYPSLSTNLFSLFLIFLLFSLNLFYALYLCLQLCELCACYKTCSTFSLVLEFSFSSLICRRKGF